ncbi:hypothetical protein D7Z26_10775 [Cohnella endophytica]|uniref:SLH domain-containing protein n=1 Tax=Cohnella endophytica TaxID=2419778 RepID=A0A494Y0J4_9BACL|nr:S-layer homology domain-containing protein [Cohnella endophytica]RKP53872.1 hypothetical protein D7Z26_10775 [Cohnella endophytica]
MKTRFPKRIKSVLSLVVLLSMFFSSFPNLAVAQDSDCASNFTTKPMVAGGSGHTVALREDGTVWAWGQNQSVGQLGNGSFNNSISPVRAIALCEIVAVAARAEQSFALKKDGTLWAWGSNDYGQLGNANGYYSSVPVQVPNLNNVGAVAAGYGHTVALKKDGTVWAWGRNDYGQLGDGTTTTVRSPVQVKNLSDVVAIAAGYSYSVALKGDGSVWTWGNNDKGQLGYDTGPNMANLIPQRVPDLNPVSAISAGYGHTVALYEDGTVVTWGWNSSGQLGNGTTTSSRDPVQVLNSLNPQQALNGVVSIAAGGMHTIALLNDNTLRVWGLNSSGQLGENTYQDRLWAVKPDRIDGIVSIGTVDAHTIAIKNDGTLWTWGNNFYGQLGYQTPLNVFTSKVPTPVEGFNVTGSNPTLVLNGRQSLSYSEWSTVPFQLQASLNNSGSDLANVTLKLIPGSGLSLVDDDAVHPVGNVPSGKGAQTTWKVKPTEEGTHQLSVYAYLEGSSEPFASATYQIEALTPTVPSNVTMKGIQAYRSNGIPVAIRSATLAFQVAFDSCTTEVAFKATDANGLTYSGFMNPIPGAAWSYVFNPQQSGLTASPLLIEMIPQCGKKVQFNIELIDPSGIVYNAARGDEKVWPLPGAEVVLQYNDPALGEWVNMSENDYPGKLSPATNPQLTGEDGRYAWDTAAGEYRVIVSRPGFQTVISRAVQVPPPVTDLHVGLNPTDKVAPSLDVNGVTNGATYTQPVTIQFGGSDDESGVRYVTYQLDDGEAQKASGANGSFQVTSPGSHVVDFKVMDHAGNELTKRIAFTISELPAPGGGSGTSNDAARFRIFIDGKAYEQIAAAGTSQEGEKSAYTVTVDTSRLAALLAGAGNRPIIGFPVAASSDKVTVVLTGDAVQALEKKQAVLELQSPIGNYTLPASEIRIDSLAKQLGDTAKPSEIFVHVSISKGDADIIKRLAKAAMSKGQYTVVGFPVDYTVDASFNGKTANANKFSAYVKREIPLPNGADPRKITTAAALETDGTIRPVPTNFASRDGLNYAVFHSLTNSTYILLDSPMTFADIDRHWAEDAVKDLASRMVVYGTDDTHYRPDAAITRAEFAAIVVRALGLADNGKVSSFSDVTAGNWYVGAVAKAQEYGIVDGYKDGTFRAMRTITRQEAISIITRAMKLVGLDTNISATDADAVLSRYSDGSDVAAWARNAVAAAAKSALVIGSGQRLMPYGDITRAETATIVQRMLQKAKLIGSSHSM